MSAEPNTSRTISFEPMPTPTGADHAEYLPKKPTKQWLRAAQAPAWHWLAWIHVQHR